MSAISLLAALYLSGGQEGVCQRAPTFMTWEVTSVRSDTREQKRMTLHMGATSPFHVYLGSGFQGLGHSHKRIPLHMHSTASLVGDVTHRRMCRPRVSGSRRTRAAHLGMYSGTWVW